MKILLPVDGSDYTRRMLAYIAAHDELFGSGHDYLVFTVVPAIPPEARYWTTADAIEHHYLATAEAVLNPVRTFARQNGWTIRASHAIGNPAETIAALAGKEHPDLIVMGSHGHTALGTLLLGSVSNGVMARCKVPVLLIQ